MTTMKPFIFQMSKSMLKREEKDMEIKILEIAEREARKRNVSIICLKCLITSWVHTWYKKHGFEDLSLDVDTDYIWMKKELD